MCHGSLFSLHSPFYYPLSLTHLACHKNIMRKQQLFLWQIKCKQHYRWMVRWNNRNPLLSESEIGKLLHTHRDMANVEKWMGECSLWKINISSFVHTNYHKCRFIATHIPSSVCSCYYLPSVECHSQTFEHPIDSFSCSLPQHLLKSPWCCFQNDDAEEGANDE